MWTQVVIAFCPNCQAVFMQVVTVLSSTKIIRMKHGEKKVKIMSLPGTSPQETSHVRPVTRNVFVRPMVPSSLAGMVLSCKPPTQLVWETVQHPSVPGLGMCSSAVINISTHLH